MTFLFAVLPLCIISIFIVMLLISYVGMQKRLEDKESQCSWIYDQLTKERENSVRDRKYLMDIIKKLTNNPDYFKDDPRW